MMMHVALMIIICVFFSFWYFVSYKGMFIHKLNEESKIWSLSLFDG